MKSIRSRLLILQTSALVVTALAISLMTFRLAWNGFNNVRDLGLEQIAETVLRHDASLDGEIAPEPEISPDTMPLDDEDDSDHFVSQIWTQNGHLLFSSWAQVGPPMQSPGHHIVTWHGQSWRLYAVPKGDRVVQIAVTTAIRRQHFYDLARWLTVPLLALVALLGFFIHLAIRDALRPLDALRSEVSQRGGQQLHAIPLNGLPTEVIPLTRTLNDLLDRLEALLDAQKRFIADAAHELNTPLAVIRLQAQLLRRMPESERGAALDELDQGIARACRMARQLLELARFDPEVRGHHMAPLALDSLVRDAVAAFQGMASARDMVLDIPQSAGIEIQGDAHALRTMLDNLIENALRYAGQGERVGVALRAGNGHAVITVADSGPGIPPEQRQRALERFVRLDEQRTQPVHGSGLGLSIVQSVVDVHHGQLSLGQSAWGGLEVCIRLPLKTQKASPPMPAEAPLLPRA